jgi:sugar lactone lactonase YvrE
VLAAVAVVWAVLSAFGVVSVAATVGRQARVFPLRPGALAVGHNGLLYVADGARDQILAMTAPGRFWVVAGTGRAGFSGDGGPAARAMLRDPAGMVVLGDGTLVFADQGNNRVRALSPQGTIRTVAGDGRFGFVTTGTPARDAPLGSPAALAVGQQGRLYIALAGANEIVRLNPDQTLTRVAGNSRFAGLYGVGRPAANASPSGPNGLAFGGGNLYIAGFNTKALLMIDAAGIMRHPGNDNGFYPRGNGGIVTAQDGRVLAINTQHVVRLTPVGERTILDFAHLTVTGVHGFLPNGIALATSGTLYLDTSNGNGWANRNAIIAVRADGNVHTLWEH